MNALKQRRRIKTDCFLVLKYIATSTSTAGCTPTGHNNKLSSVERGTGIFSVGWSSIFSMREDCTGCYVVMRGGGGGACFGDN